jgi:hypothetical protein
MHKQESMQGLLATPLRAGVDSLDNVPLQGLYAQLAELGVNQSFHSLARGGQGKKHISHYPPAPGSGVLGTLL